MTRKSVLTRATAISLGGAALLAVAPAGARTTTFVDLDAGVGYSTNPFLSLDDSGSGFGRVAAHGLHAWETERSRTALTAYLENSTYLEDHGSTQILNLGATTSYAVSQTVRLFGAARFSADRSGQLSSRFISDPRVFDPPLVPTTPGAPSIDQQPAIVQEPLFTPIGGLEPDLLGLNERQYRVGGEIGAAITLTPRDFVNLSTDVEHVFFRKALDDLDYTRVAGSVGYERKLSERATVGIRANATQWYRSGSDDQTVINPEATASLQLSERWAARAAVGMLFSKGGTTEGDDRWQSWSLLASICRSGDNEQFCGNVSRRAQTGGLTNLVIANSVGLSYFRSIGDKQTIQISGSANKYSRPGPEPSSTYYAVDGNYTYDLSSRLSIGTGVGVRKIDEEDFDRETDLHGNVFLRFRIGDLR